MSFAPSGPLVVGIDETIERRRGPKIAAAGIYRDPVRSSHGHFVKVRGLRWICLHLLVPIPWAGHVWALPFLTALAPSERYCHQRHRRYKPLTLRARQLIRLVHRRSLLATRPTSGHSWGSCVCCLGPARRRAPSSDRGRPLTPGRASVRTRPGPPAAANGQTTCGRRTAPQPDDLCERSSDSLDDLHGRALVRRAGSAHPAPHVPRRPGAAAGALFAASAGGGCARQCASWRQCKLGVLHHGRCLFHAQ